VVVAPVGRRGTPTSFCSKTVPHHIGMDTYAITSTTIFHNVGLAVLDQMMFWLPRSPDLTPCDFFFWGYVKDKVFIPLLPQDLQQLRQRIRDAVDSIDQDMLAWVWQELDCCVDVCCVTGVPTSKICECPSKLGEFPFHVISAFVE
jgi:hypothetical protein